MFIKYSDLEGDLNYSNLEAIGHQVTAEGTLLKLIGFGDAGHQRKTHQLRKSSYPPTPLSPRRPLATPAQCAEWHHPARLCLWHAQVGQCGCHRLDELLLPNLRIENGEVLSR